MQLGHVYSITVLPYTCVCPYSTVAPSVVATRAPSVEGSSEMSVSPTSQGAATGGVCVRACVRACSYVCKLCTIANSRKCDMCSDIPLNSFLEGEPVEQSCEYNLHDSVTYAQFM